MTRSIFVAQTARDLLLWSCSRGAPGLTPEGAAVLAEELAQQLEVMGNAPWRETEQPAAPC